MPFRGYRTLSEALADRPNQRTLVEGCCLLSSFEHKRSVSVGRLLRKVPANMANGSTTFRLVKRHPISPSTAMKAWNIQHTRYLIFAVLKCYSAFPDTSTALYVPLLMRLIGNGVSGVIKDKAFSTGALKV